MHIKDQSNMQSSQPNQPNLNNGKTPLDDPVREVIRSLGKSSKSVIQEIRPLGDKVIWIHSIQSHQV